MIISKPHLCTKIVLWHPRYNDKHGPLREPVALLSKIKVYHASSIILVEFSKAKSLRGGRFAITRDEIYKYPLVTNGKIECFSVPLSAFKAWDTPAEVLETIQAFGW